MSLTFKALIDGVHFDPKKGAVKIVLIGASHVSLDELTTLSPKDETVQVTLESEQTKLEPYPEEYAKRKEEEEIREQERAAGGAAIKSGSREGRELGAPITLGEKAGVELKEVAERLKKEEDEGEEGNSEYWPEHKPEGEAEVERSGGGS